MQSIWTDNTDPLEASSSGTFSAQKYLTPSLMTKTLIFAKTTTLAPFLPNTAVYLDIKPKAGRVHVRGSRIMLDAALSIECLFRDIAVLPLARP